MYVHPLTLVCLFPAFSYYCGDGFVLFAKLVKRTPIDGVKTGSFFELGRAFLMFHVCACVWRVSLLVGFVVFCAPVLFQ